MISAVLACLGSVVARARATDKRKSTVLLDKRITDLRVGVSRAVGRRDASLLQPVEGREALVVTNGRFKEVNNFLVLAVLRTVARHVEGRVACGML